MIRVDPAQLPSDPAPAGAGADASPIGASPGDASALDARALTARHLALLDRLAEMGMAIAEAATAAAVAAPAGDADAAAEEAPFRGDPALAYTRVARAVRLTLALQTQLLKDLAALEAGEAAARANRRERVHDLLRRGVADAHAEAGWSRQVELAHYARESLREAEDDADLLGLPFDEAVAAICADLGLAPAWTARLMAAAVETTDPSSSGAAEGGDPRTQQTLRAGSSLLGARVLAPRVCAPDGAPPEDDGEGEDTFLEWPPP